MDAIITLDDPLTYQKASAAALQRAKQVEAITVKQLLAFESSLEGLM
jgi:hypothetical protein